MRYKLTFYFSLLFLSSYADIATVHSIQEISEVIENTDASSLVAFDIDYVVRIEKTPTGRPWEF